MHMTIVNVDIPDSLAQKLWTETINYKIFIKKTIWLDIYENEWWIDLPVDMNAEDFLKTFKNDIL
jgi:hypothetical protein